MPRSKRSNNEADPPGPPSQRGRVAHSPGPSSTRARRSSIGSEIDRADERSDAEESNGESMGETSREGRRVREEGSERVGGAGLQDLSLDAPNPSAFPTLKAIASLPNHLYPTSTTTPFNSTDLPSTSTSTPTSTSSPQLHLPSILRLSVDFFPHLFPFLPSRDLARLSQTCRHFRDAIACWQGFNSVVLVSPGQVDPSDYTFGLANNLPGPQPQRAVSGTLPPSFPFRGTVTLGGKVYLPQISEHPSCYVLDLETLFWTRHSLAFVGTPFVVTTPQRSSSRTSFSTVLPSSTLSTLVAPSLAPSATSSSSQRPSSTSLHSGPVTGFLSLLPNSSPILYLFGGSRPSSNSPSSLSSSPPDPDSSLPSDDSVSSSLPAGRESCSSLFRVDVATWELVDMTGVDEDDSASEGSDTRIWPLPRRDHSFDVVQERWLVVFGGLEATGSSGESDIWVYDLELSVWLHPDLSGWSPRPVFLHSSVSHKDDLFVFGGTQKDHPTSLVMDGLARLSCIGPPSQWVWHTYRSSDQFTFPRASKHPQPEDPISLNDSQDPSGRSSRTGGDGAAASSSLGSTSSLQEPKSGEDSSGGSSSGSDGKKTTGISPLERYNAGMLMLGVDKLVILGGSTIEDGYDARTGSPFDDVCTYNIGAIDIFDISRRHWSRIRPPSSVDTKPIFFSECVFAPIPPDLKSPLSGWKVFTLGKALDFDDLFLTVVASEDEQSSGADASFDSSSMDLSNVQDPTPSSTSSLSLAPLTPIPPPPFSIPTTSILPQYGVRVAPPSPPVLPPVASILRPSPSNSSQRLSSHVPNEERTKSGGYISIYKRNESLVTASAFARVESKSEGSGSGSGGIGGDLSEDGDSLGSAILNFAIPSKLTTCIVVFS
ncbi:hypothetical protein BDY24DRAFT_412679 [Mrakia frigida]|uniref:uncharacterized protein n=1 Tax=Mrakia frigida TaxID=29902 RepID=UPI003FCBF48D